MLSCKFPLFATGVIDTGGKFATGINNTRENDRKFAASVVDTNGKFATLIPVVHLDLRISLQKKKFRKNWKRS
jgi:hypothetical protein